MVQIAKALCPLPQKARRSVTFDRGSEFVDWPHLQARTDAQTWFCELNRHGKKARLNMPTNACAAGCPPTPILAASAKKIFASSAQPSTRRRASA